MGLQLRQGQGLCRQGGLARAAAIRDRPSGQITGGGRGRAVGHNVVAAEPSRAGGFTGSSGPRCGVMRCGGAGSGGGKVSSGALLCVNAKCESTNRNKVAPFNATDGCCIRQRAISLGSGGPGKHGPFLGLPAFPSHFSSTRSSESSLCLGQETTESTC